MKTEKGDLGATLRPGIIRPVREFRKQSSRATKGARIEDFTVIFSPSDCLADYAGTPYRTAILNLPCHPQGDNGFNPPLPP